ALPAGCVVLCDRPIIEVCPVEWARFQGKASIRDGVEAGGGPGEDETVPLRTVLQRDKDECGGVGLVKFDLLGLGMLEALHGTIDLVREAHGVEIDLAT